MQKKLKICDGCGKEKPIWKSSGTGGLKLCQQCWSCHEGNVKQKPTVKRSPIPQRSEKRIKEERLYSAQRIIYLGEHPLCEFHIAGICTHVATDIHHTYSGKDRGEYFLDQSTWKALCRKCHDWVHMNSKEARELGYLK